MILLSQNKNFSLHRTTRHIWFALFSEKCSPKFFVPLSLHKKLQICRNVVQNRFALLHNGRRFPPVGLSLRDVAQLTAILNFCRSPSAAPKTSDSRRPLCEMHVLLLGYRPALKKNLNFVFLFIKKGV